MPPRRWPPLALREVWAHRELLFFLSWRDVTVRYRQAVLGVGWAVLQPVATAAIFTLIFGRIAGLPSEGLPYPLLTLSGLLCWQLFASSVQRAGTSLVGNASLLTKVYFPRLVIPVAAVGAGLVDFVIALAVVAVMMIAYGVVPTPLVILLPGFAALALLAALGAGTWLGALNAQYRDVGHLIPFGLGLLMWLSPVAYSAEALPEGTLRRLYLLNPMVPVIQGFRWTLLGAAPPEPWALAAAGGMILALLWTGIHYFRRVEARLADVI